MAPKAQTTKKKQKKNGLHRLKPLCFTNTIKKVRRQYTKCEKIFANHISDKRKITYIEKTIIKYIKNYHTQPEIQEENDNPNSDGPKIYMHSSPKKIYSHINYNTFHCWELVDTVTLTARRLGNLALDREATVVYNTRRNTDVWWRSTQVGLSCNCRSYYSIIWGRRYIMP